MHYVIIGGNESEKKFIKAAFKANSTISLLGKFDDFTEAFSFLFENKVSLLILITDLQDEVVQYLGSLDPGLPIIIISGSSDNALKAFDYNVIDFLARPLKPARLLKSVQRYNTYSWAHNTTDKKSLFIKDKDKFIHYELNDILYIEALQNYILIHTPERKIKFHMSMKQIEKKIPTGQFARVHRSYIVNLANIETIKDNEIYLKGQPKDQHLTPSKTYRKNLFSRINVL